MIRIKKLRVAELSLPKQIKDVIISSGVSTLYPPQEDAIKGGALNGKNLVLASPTASGKTLIAEICAIKHAIEKGGKTLYLTPLRALASEKFEDFKKYTKIKKKNGRRIRVAISTGDYDSSDHWLNKYDVIITTNEKCDSLLRHRPDWINEITLVVADEIHTLMDSDRGPTLEVTLTRLMETNPRAQILALSATISNAEELAAWLNATSITTDWRPVKLIEGVYLEGECQFNNGSSIKINEEDTNPALNLALHTIKDGGQTLVFVTTRRRTIAYSKRAIDLVKKLLSKPEKKILHRIANRTVRIGEKTRLSDLLADCIKNGVAFHHAGLTASHRKIVEDSFRDGQVKIVFATPTLAFGVNLPARMVVIANTQRYNPRYGLDEISVLEYKQMIGRAGRPKYDKIGEASLISKTEEEQDYFMERYVFSKPEIIWSKLAVEGVLRSHVLASIASGFTYSEQGLMDFFRKTFYAKQFTPEFLEALIGKVLKYLHAEQMIKVERRTLKATRFGRKVSQLYIDPVSGAILRDGLQNHPTYVTDLGLLQLVCRTPDIFPKYYPRRKEIDSLNTFVESHADEFFFSIPGESDIFELEKFLGEVKCACVLSAWIQEVTEDKILQKFSVEPGDLFRLISSVDWLLYATQKIAGLFGHKNLLERIYILQQRVKKGVKQELLPLVALEGVGRVRGKILFNAGYKTVNALKKASITQLTNLPLIGPQIAKKIKEQVGGVIKTKELEKLQRKKEWEQKALLDFS